MKVHRIIDECMDCGRRFVRLSPRDALHTQLCA
jgi:hypothetical protein